MSEPEPWTKLFQRIKSQIPAAPDALIRQEISDIMIDFTSDTNLWQETVPINIVPNTLSYPFTVTSGYPNRLLVVYRDGDPNQFWADNYISMRVPGVIQLGRAVSQAALWHAVVAKATSTPNDDTGYPEIDNWVVDQFTDTLYYGVMWLLQRMPAKSFRDPNAAKENSVIYNSARSQARVQGMRSNVYNGQSWMYPQSFRTTTRKGWA